jgi:hypothetical protein
LATVPYRLLSVRRSVLGIALGGVLRSWWLPLVDCGCSLTVPGKPVNHSLASGVVREIVVTVFATVPFSLAECLSGVLLHERQSAGSTVNNGSPRGFSGSLVGSPHFLDGIHD